jgi:superfamily II DNA helicase RecQ
LSSTLPNPLTPVSVAKAAGISRQNQGSPAKSLPAQPAQDQAEPATVNDLEIQILVQKVVQKEGLITFKSPEQEIALRAILARETPLVVVLPTGGGKSLLFIAPACLSDPGVTIVVVPFRKLLKNLKTRLAEAKIPATEWIPRLSANGPAPIILVSADAAKSFKLLTFATLLMQGG